MITCQHVNSSKCRRCQFVNLSTCNEISNITKCQMSWSDKFFVILSGTFSIFCHHLSSLWNFSLFLPILTLFGYFWYPLATFCNFFATFARLWQLWAIFRHVLAAFDNSWKTWLFLATVGKFMLLWANFGIFLPAFAALINFGLLLWIFCDFRHFLAIFANVSHFFAILGNF